MTKVTHYANGNIKSIEIRNTAGELHNPNGPAYQEWHENGQERYRRYCVDGKQLTEDEFNKMKSIVTITVEGRDIQISREIARALGLVK